MFFKGKKDLSSVFLGSKNSFSQKRSLKSKNVLIAFCSVLIVFVVLGSVSETKKGAGAKSPFFSEKLNSQVVKEVSEYEDAEQETEEYDNLDTSDIRPIKKTKEDNSQLLVATSKNNFTGAKVLVELIGRVKSSAGLSAPIEARVLSNILDNADMVNKPQLEEGSKLLGVAKLNPNLERLEITFHSLIDHFGKQKPIKAQAFMPDGSFGIRGNYSSGELKKYGSRMAGNFLGGLSQGLKQRSFTKAGAILEIGNLKNAVLNGVSLSALDYAREKSRKHEVSKVSIELEHEARFFVRFLSKEVL